MQVPTPLRLYQALSRENNEPNTLLLISVLDNLPYPFFIADFSQRLIFVNRFLLNKLPPFDYTGKRGADLLNHFCSNGQALFDQLIKVRESTTISCEHKTYKVRCSLMQGDTGLRQAFLVVFTDVESTDEAEQTLQSIVNGAPGGVFRMLCDDELTILYSNEPYNHLHGYDIDPAKRRTAKTDAHPVDFRKIRYLVTQATQSREEAIHFEIRIFGADGKIHWLSCGCGIDYSGSIPILNGIELDITANKELEQNLRMSEQQLKIAFAQTQDSIWAYDIVNSTIRQSRFSMKQFGGPELLDNVPEGQIQRGMIHPDSVDDYLRMHRRIHSGAKEVRAVIRIRSKRGGYGWHQIIYKVIHDADGNAVRAIGVSKDITAEMKAKIQAERDPLTHLYNRTAFKSQIADYIASIPKPGNTSDIHAAMIMIDLDNFKRANDSFGHAFGDQVLTDVAERLISVFRYNDIITRLGGDEFAIFLPDLPSEDFVHKRAVEVCKALQLTYYDDDTQTVKYTTSCSLGIAFYPKHGDNFKTLYDNADIAQYNAKRRGKNQYAIYGIESDTAAQAGWMNKEWLIDELEELVYISNTDTYDMIYLNRAGRAMTGMRETDLTGKKCYEIMRDRNSPCEHCNNARLSANRFISWENYNPKLSSQTMIMKAKLVYWDGMLCRMEYAINPETDAEVSHQMKDHR